MDKAHELLKSLLPLSDYDHLQEGKMYGHLPFPAGLLAFSGVTADMELVLAGEVPGVSSLVLKGLPSCWYVRNVMRGKTKFLDQGQSGVNFEASVTMEDGSVVSVVKKDNITYHVSMLAYR